MKRSVFSFILFLFGVSAVYSLEPAELILAFERVISEIHDYQCRLSQWSVSGDRIEKKILNYYFGYDRHIRIDVLEGNRGAGGTGILRVDGKVAARAKFLFVHLRFVLESSHSAVTTIRGRTFRDGSLMGILEMIRSHSEECDVDIERNDSSYVIYSVDCKSNADRRTVIELDADSLLPIISRTFEFGEIVEYVMWTNYTVNGGLPVHIFDIKTKLSEMTEIQEAVVARTAINDRERIVSGIVVD